MTENDTEIDIPEIIAALENYGKQFGGFIHRDLNILENPREGLMPNQFLVVDEYSAESNSVLFGRNNFGQFINLYVSLPSLQLGISGSIIPKVMTGVNYVYSMHVGVELCRLIKNIGKSEEESEYVVSLESLVEATFIPGEMNLIDPKEECIRSDGSKYELSGTPFFIYNEPLLASLGMHNYRSKNVELISGKDYAPVLANKHISSLKPYNLINPMERLEAVKQIFETLNPNIRRKKLR